MGYLQVMDYLVIVFVLLVSSSIGIYHALRGGRQRTSHEYFLAERGMHPVPVILSVVVSVLSAVTYLGTPAEVYVHGPGFWVIFPAKVIPVYIITRSFCPIFYQLKVTSIYEYLEMRFDKLVRYCGVFINFVYLFLYLGVVMYGPALALNAVTGLSLTGSILAVGIVCTFYSTVGGIKAVVWTDVFQSSIMITGFLITIAACLVNIGGFAEVFKLHTEGNRDNYFDMRLNPAIRHSFWSVFIGGGMMMLSFAGTNQIIVQRYMTCRTLDQAKFAAGVGIAMIGLVELIAVFTGMCLYAYYAGCDPLQEGKITRADQLMAFLFVDLFASVPGLAGLQVAATFSASLSTVSSGINAMATLIGEDIIRKLFTSLSDSKYTLLMKVFSLCFGVICVLTAFLASRLGGMLTLGLSLVGILNGPILGAFCLGIYFPRCNSKGAISGIICAAVIAVWFKTGALFYPPILNDPPLSVEECSATNTTALYDFTTYVGYTVIDNPLEIPEKFTFTKVYSLSYIYYTPFTSGITILVGMLVSLITTPNDPASLDPELLSPIAKTFCCCLPGDIQGTSRCAAREEKSYHDESAREHMMSEQPGTRVV